MDLIASEPSRRRPNASANASSMTIVLDDDDPPKRRRRTATALNPSPGTIIDLTEPDPSRTLVPPPDARPGSQRTAQSAPSQMPPAVTVAPASGLRAPAADPSDKMEPLSEMDTDALIGLLVEQDKAAEKAEERSRIELADVRRALGERLADAKELAAEERAAMQLVDGRRAFEEKRLANGRALGWAVPLLERNAHLVAALRKMPSVLKKPARERLANETPQEPVASLWDDCGRGRPVAGQELKLAIRRTHLAVDLLRALHGMERAWQLYCTPNVTFEGEDGVDHGGLTVELFAEALSALRDLPLQAVSGSPHGGGCLFTPSNMPLRDAAIGHTAPISLSPTPCAGPASPSSGAAYSSAATNLPPRGPSVGTGGPDDGSLYVDTCGAWRLIGRLLAWNLCQPAGNYIDDRFPDVLLEYLCTDNMESLRTVSGAMAALSQVRSHHTAFAKNYLQRPVAELGEELLIQPTKRDLFDHGDWDECLGHQEDECPCARTPLLDEGKEAFFLAAVWSLVYGCRRRHLEALKEGFQGGDWPCIHEQRARDFSSVLGRFPVSVLASRLRGEAVDCGSAVWKHLRLERPENDEPGQLRCVNDAEFALTSQWLRDYVCGLEARDAKRFLRFFTSQPTKVPVLSRDATYTAPTVLIYTDWGCPRDCIFLPTASTCEQRLFVPVFPVQDVLWTKLTEALEWSCASGSGFTYE